MSEKKIAIFQGKQIRRYWDDKNELWYFSIVDVVGVLSESRSPRTYWKVLKNRLRKEGSEVVTKCNQLKIQAFDNMYQAIINATKPCKFAKITLIYFGIIKN